MAVLVFRIVWGGSSGMQARDAALKRRAHQLPLPVLAFLEHVLDRGLVDHQVGSAGTVELDAALVVPLDVAVDFLAVAQHYDHGGLGLHLLLVVEVFGVGLLGGGAGLFGRAGGAISAFCGQMVVSVVVVISPAERWANQLTIRKAFLIGGLFGWYRVEGFFHIATTCARGGRICHNTTTCNCGY